MYRRPGRFFAQNREGATIHKGSILIIAGLPPEYDSALVPVTYPNDMYDDHISFVAEEDALNNAVFEVKPIHEGICQVRVNVLNGDKLFAGSPLWVYNTGTQWGTLTTRAGYGYRLPAGICVDPAMYLVSTSDTTEVLTYMTAFKTRKW